MKHISVSPTEAIGFGWKTFQKRKTFWVIAALLLFTLGNGGDIRIGNRWKSDAETSAQRERSTKSPREDAAPLKKYERGRGDDSVKSLPFVPANVDNVLGISKQRERGHIGAFLVLFIFAAVVFSLPYIIAVCLVSGAIQMGFLQFFLSAVRGTNPRYETILSEINIGKSFRFLLSSFLYVLLTLVGCVLFIIPGIYFALTYAFAPFIVVDKNHGIKESFTRSAKLTKGNKWNLLGLGALVLLVNIAGFLALLYGLLVSVPVSMLACLYAYNKLLRNASSA